MSDLKQQVREALETLAELAALTAFAALVIVLAP